MDKINNIGMLIFFILSMLGQLFVKIYYFINEIGVNSLSTISGIDVKVFSMISPANLNKIILQI